MATFKLAHIINVVDAPDGSELARCQPVVVQSMVNARKQAGEKCQVSLLACHFANENFPLPDGITRLPHLTHTVNDFVTLEKKRPLPLLREILQKGIENSDADYFIYTNADIAVMPFFYSVVAQYLEQGHDALIINRRRIPVTEATPNDLEKLYAHAGKTHTGYDCFVFHRSLYAKFIFHNTCIGVPPACNDLAHNFFAHAQKFSLLTDQHLTFHMGMELYKSWGDKQIVRFNYSEYRKMMKELKPHFRIENFPGSNLPFFKRHFKWLMNPTFHYPTMFKLDFKQWNHKRPPRVKKKKSLKARYAEWLIRKINFD